MLHPSGEKRDFISQFKDKENINCSEKHIWIENESQRNKMNRKSVGRELTRGTRNSNENSRVFLDIGF